MGNGRPGGGASGSSESARTSGIISGRYAVPNSWNEQAGLNRRRGVAWLLSATQPAYHRALRKSANRVERLCGALKGDCNCHQKVTSMMGLNR
jgi:hypothetical protein